MDNSNIDNPTSKADDFIYEGKAKIQRDPSKVFYNNIQQFNRDLSVFVINAWCKVFKEEKELLNKKKSKKRKRISDSKHEEEKEREEGQKKNEDYINKISDEKKIQFCNILEGLSATGLRAIRYGLEIPNAKYIVANDFSKDAVLDIQKNIIFNNLESKILPCQGDANLTMHLSRYGIGSILGLTLDNENKNKTESEIKTENEINPSSNSLFKNERFHCIDLDPYGTAAPFIDQAVQSVVNGGLLLVTCTDAAVLAGSSYPEKCYANYGGMSSINSDYCHESALRLLLGLISTSAARYARSITPLLSLSIDYYLRVFVRVKQSPAQVKFLPSKMMFSYQCTGCTSFALQNIGKSSLVDDSKNIYKHTTANGPPVSPSCVHCGNKHRLAGPMYSGSLHNHEFIRNVLQLVDDSDQSVYGTIPRIKGMLNLALEELDTPFYISLPHISSILHCECPPIIKIYSALLNAGYKISGTHCMPNAVKTNAPFDVIWDIFRAWIKDHPVNPSRLHDLTPAKKILERTEPSFPVDFTLNPNAKLPSKSIKITRYQANPEVNWGPRSKPK